MPKMTITERVEINSPVEEVYGYIQNFEKWKEWSPWLICEQDCSLYYAEDSSSWYSWDGKYVGAGKMQVIRTVANENFEYLLEFIKPWKSKADVQFNLTETANGTEVEWAMQSSLPWFLWWMKPMMIRMIAMDYQRGLKMLKEMLEAGSVDCKLEYSANESFVSCHYLGIEGVCQMDDMEASMGGDFEKLTAMVKEKGIEVTEFFTIYHKWKLGKGEVTYTVCAGQGSVPENVPEGFISGVRETCDAFVVEHTGAYHHLGNAWSAGMMRARSKPSVFKQSKKIPPFEVYLTLPGSGEELETKVVFPKA